MVLRWDGLEGCARRQESKRIWRLRKQQQQRQKAKQRVSDLELSNSEKSQVPIDETPYRRGRRRVTRWLVDARV
jgi:hypothetical protein